MSVLRVDDTSASPNHDVQALYTELALHPNRDFGWGKGKENARRLGYERSWLDRLPHPVWESAAAVGNPFGLGTIDAGETVIDLGCGAGADLCIAALLVGNDGWALGVDITSAMVSKAKQNVALAGLGNAEVYQADFASLPFGDACADVLISNGSINLSSHKPCVFKEAFRILRPGGRFQFADMVKHDTAEPTDGASCASWADCVAGTLEPEQYLQMLKAAGFEEAKFVSFTGYRTAATTMGATFRASKVATRTGQLASRMEGRRMPTWMRRGFKGGV